MKHLMAMTTAALLTAGCGAETAKKTAAETPKTLVAGEYEVSSEVTKLASADKSTPATPLKMGDRATSRTCIAADGAIDPAMIVAAGDTCTADSSYIRSGRLSVQYSCDRPKLGKVYPAADGNFTADGFKALVTESTAFAGDGDYNLVRTLTAKRVGACPAGGVAKT